MEKKHYIDMELVKKLMQEKNIDVQTMANSVGLTSKTLKKYLDGADQNHSTVNLLFRLAKALDVPMTHLIHKDYTIIQKKN